jgi:hypothetical protein
MNTKVYYQLGDYNKTLELLSLVYDSGDAEVLKQAYLYAIATQLKLNQTAQADTLRLEAQNKGVAISEEEIQQVLTMPQIQ